MTKDQAKELFRSVDEILAFASKDSGLTIHQPVKRKLISRVEVGRFLQKKFAEDEGAKKMERAELVLKKFGLLERDFQLRPFLLSLLTEQIAGFYDNKTKTVNLLDWIEPEEQKPVLAHELTHALQDQAVDLDRWSDAGVHGLARNAKEDDAHLATDELETARAAVAEGQAMAVFLDYGLRPSGKTIVDAPELAERLRDPDMSSASSPILSRAPLLLQQSLLFPYSDGLGFEQAVLIHAGKDAAFAGVLARPPSSSHEIMHPLAYLAHTPVPTLRLPDVHPLLDGDFLPYDVGVMGELDVRILSELFGGKELAAALSPNWDGGLYYAAQRRSAVTAADRQSTTSLSLFYLSRWKNSDSARTFARIYSSQLQRKYSRVKSQEGSLEGGEQVFSTNEGDVLISRTGNTVFISEGFDLSLGRKIRQITSDAQTSGPIMNASDSLREPSLLLVNQLQSAGWTASLQRAYESMVFSQQLNQGTWEEQQKW